MDFALGSELETLRCRKRALVDEVVTPAEGDRSAWDEHENIRLDRLAELQPIVEGRVRSAFAMTEPAPGSGSDPGMMRASTRRRDGRWLIEGCKWLIIEVGIARRVQIMRPEGHGGHCALTSTGPEVPDAVSSWSSPMSRSTARSASAPSY